MHFIRNAMRELIDDASVITLEADNIENAARKFHGFKQSADYGFLREFVCPISGLTHLTYDLDFHSDPAPVPIKVVGSSTGDWDRDRGEDAILLNEFQTASASTYEVKSYRVPYPFNGSERPSLDSLQGFASADVQLDLTASDHTSDLVAEAAEREWLSVRLCADEPGSFLAQFIADCNGLEVPYQLPDASARLFSSDGETGCLNLFAAAVLAFTEELASSEILGILRAPGVSHLLPNQFQIESFKFDATAVEFAQTVFWGFGVRNIERLCTNLAGLEQVG